MEVANAEYGGWEGDKWWEERRGGGEGKGEREGGGEGSERAVVAQTAPELPPIHIHAGVMTLFMGEISERTRRETMHAED